MTGAEGAAVAGHTFLRRLLQSLSGRAEALIERKLDEWSADNQIKSIYTKMADVRTVRTILVRDAPVNICSFYHPNRVVVEDEPTSIDKLSDVGVPRSRSILLTGVVGQGKSTLLRHLCYQELMIPDRLPIFLELRKLTSGSSIAELILEELHIIGFREIDKPIFEYLALSGKVTLFLEGFDEVIADMKERLYWDLIALTRMYEDMRIAVTSRPNSILERSEYFIKFPICPIPPREIESVIGRLAAEEKYGEALREKLRDGSSDDILPLLTTPLMITILTIQFRAKGKLFGSAENFFNRLFHLLIEEHDEAKPHVRHRQSRLTNQELRRIFDRFCHLCNGVHELTSQAVMDMATESIEGEGVKCPASCFVDDIVLITGLLLKGEDRTYRFIHDCVREYHSTSHILSWPDKDREKFYSDAVSSPALLIRWQDELALLKTLDDYMYNQHLVIQGINNVLRRITENHTNIEVVYQLADSYNLGRHPDRDGLILVPSGRDLAWFFMQENRAVECYRVYIDWVGGRMCELKRLFQRETMRARPAGQSLDGGTHFISAKKVLERITPEDNVQTVAIQLADNIIKDLMELLAETEEVVKCLELMRGEDFTETLTPRRSGS
ncbi:hypothetical protein JYT15_01095 [Acidimicrobium ferrooxidans]|nr:hypothetical protein [Acidimicrobium ferrooxidans]